MARISKKILIIFGLVLFARVYFFMPNKAQAAIFDVRIEYPPFVNPEIDCDIGDSIISPANPLCGFIPRTITINLGDQIRWINNDSVRVHEPASNPHPTHENYQALNMPIISSAGGTVITAPLVQAGIWGCHDHQDSSFSCVVIIQAPAAGGAKEIDETPPVISDIQAVINTNSAVVSWKTNEVASTQVEYGLTADYGMKNPLPLNYKAAIFHEVFLIDLAPGQQYNFRVRSIDSYNNLGVSTDQVFTTKTLAETLKKAPTVEISSDTAIKETQLKLINLLQRLLSLLTKLKELQLK